MGRLSLGYKGSADWFKSFSRGMGIGKIKSSMEEKEPNKIRITIAILFLVAVFFGVEYIAYNIWVYVIIFVMCW